MTEDMKQARLMKARALLSKYGLDDWQISIVDLCRVKSKNPLTGDHSFGTIGLCDFFNKRILIDESLVKYPTRCRQTALHEIAHALAGPLAGHGPRWLKIARQIGCRPRSLRVYKILQ